MVTDTMVNNPDVYKEATKDCEYKTEPETESDSESESEDESESLFVSGDAKDDDDVPVESPAKPQKTAQNDTTPIPLASTADECVESMNVSPESTNMSPESTNVSPESTNMSKLQAVLARAGEIDMKSIRTGVELVKKTT